MKKKYIILLIVLLFTATYFLRGMDFSGLLAVKEESQKDNYYLQDNGDVQLYFCPQEECEEALVQFLQSAQESIHCALFEINLASIQEVLVQKQKVMEVKVVTDNGYIDEFNHSFVKADRSGLMHNKFCIVDGKKVSTGSMNPTINCAHKNNNNLLLINSPLLAQNYEDEFQEMWNGTFKKGGVVKNPNIKVGETGLSVYFCPEDHCAFRVEEELKKAQRSIRFMTFSFTHDGIGNIILMKNTENLSIKGVMETTQIDSDSEYGRFIYQGMDVLKDGNKNNLHHKVFIIDNRTVVTGSFNPSANGDKGNDENLLIIDSEEIARSFLGEFEKVRGEAVNKSKLNIN